MNQHLITPSLYNAWRWWIRSEGAEAARNAFLATLRREEVAPNEAMLAGRKFEDDVQMIASGWPHPTLDLQIPEYQDCVHEVAGIVRGGLWQERIYHTLSFRSHGEFLLYGKIDVIKGPWVYDIKFVRSYDIGKFFHNIQHVAYMAGSAQKRFAYLISDGRSVWREDYFWVDRDYEQMRGNLSDMLDDINRDREFARLYATHWRAREPMSNPGNRQDRSATGAPASPPTDQRRKELQA